MKRLYNIVLVTLLFSVISIYSQNRPYPQQLNFPNCLKPNTTQMLLDYHTYLFYKDTWKAKFFKESKYTTGGYYVFSEGTGGTNIISVSEAHGYGMIIMALMAGDGPYAEPDAKKYFDGMYTFFRNKPSKLCSEFMTWKITTEENGGDNSASDGDLDIAYALMLAHYQWGSNGAINYMQEAKNIVDSMETRIIKNDRIMLGDWWNEFSPTTHEWDTRSSDWMTDHFHLFYKETGSGIWKTLATNVYTLASTIASEHSPNTGLMPDFVIESPPKPSPPNSFEGPNDGDFYYNACRFPLRMAVDYAHYGTAEAKQACNRIIDWIIDETGGEPYDKIMLGYKLDGTALSTYTDMAFTCPIIAAAIVGKGSNDKNYQSFLDKGWNAIKGDTEEIESYSASIRLLSQLLMSGNWWSPNITPITYEPNTHALQENIKLHAPAQGKSITVTYSLTQPAKVHMRIVNLQGKTILRVLTSKQQAGTYSLTADLEKPGVGSGIYFINMSLDERSVNRQFTIVK